jgi:hypothetical protein
MKRGNDSGSDNMVFSVLYGTSLLACREAKPGRVILGRRIIGTYGGLEGWYIGNYFTGAVRNENASCKGVGAFRECVDFSVLTDGLLARALLRIMHHLACRCWAVFDLHDFRPDRLLDMGLAQPKQTHATGRIRMYTGLKAATYLVHA